MFENIKKLFRKEETFPCIVWDGKTMSYPHLTQKQIDDINTKPEYKGWIVTLKKEQ
ncbi:hypothetical protein [Arcobacter sp. LA11]|uniref:hypothetical protein n=1 Tax=Arcobacter sp. LA11 TaxID=1898176 RepID=UPI000AB50763|nr:hypothetical protein [Arcobacter sp. LA11]